MAKAQQEQLQEELGQQQQEKSQEDREQKEQEQKEQKQKEQEQEQKEQEQKEQEQRQRVQKLQQQQRQQQQQQHRQHQQLDYLEEVDSQQIAEFRDAFALIDNDGDGFVTKEELRRAFEAFGLKISEQQLEAAIYTVDDDGDGSLDFTEFVSLLTRCLTSSAAGTDLRLAFSLLDRDSSGCVGRDELASVLTNFGYATTAAEAGHIIREADVDGDGQIDYEEFLRLLSGSLPPEFLHEAWQ